MTVMEQFDLGAGQRAADRAIDQVEAHADERWLDRALEAVRFVAERRVTFTTDPVWFWLGKWGVPHPHEPRAMGAVMRRAQKEGWISPTQEFVPTTRVKSHKSPTRVWASLIHEGD